MRTPIKFNAIGKILSALIFCFLFCTAVNSQSITIYGPTCVNAGTQYSYGLSSSYSGQTLQWCITGGTIVGYGACQSGTGLNMVNVTWTAGTGRSLSVTITSGGSGNGTINVTVTTSVIAGTISNTSQTINYGLTPATLNCSVATGGGCGPNYNYQWQSSTNNVTFSDISGATTQNLTFSSGLTQTTYYKRKVTETVSSTVAYSNVATVFVNPPTIVPGSSSPSYQLFNRYNSAPMTLVTKPATLATCPEGNCFVYQWQQSTNGTTWNDISGANSLTYNPGLYSPTTNTYYRTKITASGLTAYSNVDTIYSQYSIINGPVDCWVGQTVTYYQIPGGGDVSQYSWGLNTTAGAFSGGTFGVGSVTIKWNAAVTGTITLTNNGVEVATIMVYVHTLPINPGLINKPIQNIEATSAITISPFPGTGATGGTCTGLFSYQWQQSTDSINYTNISGQTGLSLTITPSQNTYYRRRVTCGSSFYTDTTYITRYPYFNPGTTSSANSDSIGWNASPSIINGTFPNGGVDSIYRYQWEFSIDGTNYYEVPTGSQGQDYQPERLATTTWFRRRVTNGLTTRYTNTSQVKVKVLQFYTGVISPYTLVINSGTSPSLTGTAATGGTVATYTYQWQESTDEVNWKNSTGAATQNYSPGALSKTTYYRRLVTNGAQSGYAVASGAFNVLKIKVRATAGGVNTPTTATQATSDPGINAVAPNAYTLPSITNAKINYVRSWDIEKPAVTTLAAAKALTAMNDFNLTTAYFDDLGRPVQSVSKMATPLQKDMIAGIVNYDLLGRAVQEYLPYTDNTVTGDFKTTHTTQQSSFYNSFYTNTEGFYYSNSVYEKSPLNRVLKNTAPGKSFTGSNVGVRTDYGFNTTLDSVKFWTIGLSDTAAPVMVGNYVPGSLVLVVTTDEHENKVMEYKDKEGKTILKKVQLSDTIFNGYKGWLSTFYVYDVFARLRYVLPPKVVEYAAVNNWILNQTIRDELCFRYHYDENGRMKIKKVPGAGEVWMVYDSRDRLVMTQDSLMRLAPAKWMYTQYDSLNRPVLTGLWTNSSDRHFHQGQAASSIIYPSPGSGFEILTQNYYDNYLWVSGTGSGLSTALITTNTTNTTYFYAASSVHPFPQAITGDKHTHGAALGTKTKVLGTATYVYTVSFFDSKGRLLQTQVKNFSGGRDTITTQYDFSGKVLRNLVAHEKLGTNPQRYKIGTKNEYDHAGRLFKVSKKTGNSPEVVITENVYDELGQLSKKSVGRKRDAVNTNTYTGNPVDTLRYAYNIRGWLRGINKDYARNENGAVNWFGMELDYDFGFNAKQFNGNIAGIRWRSKGDGEERAYGFAYDNVNRLMKGEFTQNNGGWSNTAGVDFSMKMGDGNSPYSAYDANGNIYSMTHRGLKLNNSPVIDTLRYGYNTTSNKLNYVTDIANDVNTKLGDFKEINNNTSTDYAYDGNGNMTSDNNKAIASITYNHLNLPLVITVTGKGTITYTYDATGNKQRKVTVDNTVTPSKTTTTLYSGGLIYQNDTIQLFMHEEGRIRPKRVGFTDTLYYDYFLKDHLGNVRTVLTDELQQDIYPATTLEGTYSDANTAVGYEKNFYTIDASKIVDATTATGITTYENNNGIANPYPPGNSGNTNVTANSQKLYRLQASAVANGGVNGLGMTLKVMSGDKIDIMGKSYYFQSNSGGNNYAVPVTDIIAGLLGATSGTAAAKGFTSTDLNGQSGITGPITSFLSNAGRGTGTVPKAYINWILFDENFKFVSGNFSRVGTANTVKSHYGDASLQNIPVTKNGYLYVYASNESPVAVFFDNLQVIHTKGPLVEETHYYPFGLTMAGISSKAAGKPENKKKFVSQDFDDELGWATYQFKFRTHDPQIGRFLQIDPLANEYVYNSTYAYAENRPIDGIDLEGLEFLRTVGNIARDAIVNPGMVAVHVSNYIAAKKSEYSGSVAAVDRMQKGQSAQPSTPGPPHIQKAQSIANQAKDAEKAMQPASDVLETTVTLASLVPVIEAGVAAGAGAAVKTVVKSAGFSDDAVVVRGGLNKVDDIIRGTGTHPEGVTGVSVNCGNCSVAELSKNIPNKQIGVTTVGEVRSVGGDVIKTSGRDPNHATMTGLTPQQASSLLNPPIKKPPYTPN